MEGVELWDWDWHIYTVDTVYKSLLVRIYYIAKKKKPSKKSEESNIKDQEKMTTTEDSHKRKEKMENMDKYESMKKKPKVK